jgi:lipopolysaccharide/colanic/teichoic acid biosynthesis glycosyltransferase
MMMAGNPIIGHYSMPQPQFAAESLDLSGTRIRAQATAAASLLRPSPDVLSPSEHQEDSAVWTGSDWEQISLAVHRLRTNGVYYRLGKRLLDIITVCVFLPYLVPLFLIVALIVRLSSPGPLLYRQRRIGRFGREFTLWKFRSMYWNSDEILCNYLAANPEAAHEWKQTHKLRNDPRVTRLGQWLRRTSLDELPQFLNVLLGTMSLVGPRPIVFAEKVQYRESYFFYASAKPGLTGLWQVSGRSNLSYRQRVALDVEYIRGWNLALDIQILWRTAGAVWASKGAI